MATKQKSAEEKALDRSNDQIVPLCFLRCLEVAGEVDLLIFSDAEVTIDARRQHQPGQHEVDWLFGALEHQKRDQAMAECADQQYGRVVEQ